jgi:hypothetical protein
MYGVSVAVPLMWLSLASGLAQYKYLSALQINQLIERALRSLSESQFPFPAWHTQDR